jgi:hypothetical protein
MMGFRFRASLPENAAENSLCVWLYSGWAGPRMGKKPAWDPRLAEYLGLIWTAE